jgi:ABC-type multidrug transport system ATPase subunit
VQRELLTEIVSDLARRQGESVSAVQRGLLETEGRLVAVDRRHAGVLERLERMSARIDRLSQRLGALRSGVRALRTPQGSTVQTETAQTAIAPTERAVARTAVTDGERAPTSPVLLRVEHLSKEIGGVDILSDITFEIYANEILGLIGPNGAGKTTLLECLANLRPRTSGTFYEGDVAPSDWNPSRFMFYLPNGMTPYSELYSIDVLSLFGRMFEVEPARWEHIIASELSLGPVLQKKVSALSKGNLQRLLIALALMSPQPLLALDEPFDGLDLHQTHAMMDILRGLRAQQRTLMLCIHQLQDAERICDRLLLLSNGKLAGAGTLDHLRERAGLAAGQGSLEDVFLRLTGRAAQAPEPASPVGMKNS